MRKFLYSFVALCVALMATSCLYGKGFGEETGGGTAETGFKAEASASVISANGEDVVTFRAIYNGEDVTAEATLYDAGTNEALEGMSFSTIAAGVYTFYVTYGEYKSENITVTAVLDIDLSDKEETGLTVTLSTNLVQVGKNYAAFIVRYNGKVIAADEVKKVVVYNAEDDQPIALPKDGESTIGSEINYVVIKDENNVEHTLLAYTPNEAGSKSFWFGYKVKNTRETPLTITAVTTNIPSSPVDADPSNLNFVHRTLFTQFTGTWCGNCPYMIAAFHYMFEDATYKNKFVHTAIHSGDIFKVKLEDGRDLATVLNATGNYPYLLEGLADGIANSQVETNISNIMGAIEQDHKLNARAAIAARTELNDNVLLVRTTIKVAETDEYYIGAWLVESGMYSPQSNYTTMKDDYLDYHENVVRIADSNPSNRFLGHPLGSILKGEKADHLFVMELDPSWNVENCHLVIFVSTYPFNLTKLTVTNVVKTASLTSGVDFEYSK